MSRVSDGETEHNLKKKEEYWLHFFQMLPNDTEQKQNEICLIVAKHYAKIYEEILKYSIKLALKCFWNKVRSDRFFYAVVFETPPYFEEGMESKFLDDSINLVLEEKQVALQSCEKGRLFYILWPFLIRHDRELFTSEIIQCKLLHAGSLVP